MTDAVLAFGANSIRGIVPLPLLIGVAAVVAVATAGLVATIVGCVVGAVVAGAVVGGTVVGRLISVGAAVAGADVGGTVVGLPVSVAAGTAVVAVGWAAMVVAVDAGVALVPQAVRIRVRMATSTIVGRLVEYIKFSLSLVVCFPFQVRCCERIAESRFTKDNAP